MRDARLPYSQNYFVNKREHQLFAGLNGCNEFYRVRIDAHQPQLRLKKFCAGAQSG